MRDFYDVIVIGGGHAGTEAAWAAASVLSSRVGQSARVALITMDPSKIGTMSCNPAIGGLAKGQMVREIDALGGLMALATDATGIMFKMLNTSKGAAVRGPRAQCDKYAYAAEVQRLISTRANIDVIAGTIDDIAVQDGRVIGVMVPAGGTIVVADRHTIDRNQTNSDRAHPIYAAASRPQPQTTGRLIRAHAVVLTTGTFMRALMHTGERKTVGGRVSEGSAIGISHALRTLGLELGRLKTGTPPRLARESIDWESLPAQHGDDPPIPFSDLANIQEATSDELAAQFRSRANATSSEDGVVRAAKTEGRRFLPRLPQIACRVTRTTAQAHELIRANIHRAPMYSGQIDAECGPRYCPSIEDKVIRFAERDSHHVFLEPESLHTREIYCNGISTSLPEDVQERIVHAMPGCERAEILRYGYAVEYDMVWPHQIDSTAMVKSIPGLFLAGQINGTSGYEEAGGQGLIAGLNAALVATSLTRHATLASSHRSEQVRLSRDQAYIGVMMDDLVTKTPREPYRMFTSRAEHRLHLRSDNADVRLTPLARTLGLIDDDRWRRFESRSARLERLRNVFDRTFVDGKTLREFARRPDATLEAIAARMPREEAPIDRDLLERAVTEARYDGYITRQRAEVRRQSEADHHRIPDWLEPHAVTGLRRETMETLARFRPQTFGQASRLAGITPADLTLLAVHIKRGRERAKSQPVERSI